MNEFLRAGEKWTSDGFVETKYSDGRRWIRRFSVFSSSYSTANELHLSTVSFPNRYNETVHLEFPFEKFQRKKRKTCTAYNIVGEITFHRFLRK